MKMIFTIVEDRLEIYIVVNEGDEELLVYYKPKPKCWSSTPMYLSGLALYEGLETDWYGIEDYIPYVTLDDGYIQFVLGDNTFNYRDNIMRNLDTRELVDAASLYEYDQYIITPDYIYDGVLYQIPAIWTVNYCYKPEPRFAPLDTDEMFVLKDNVFYTTIHYMTESQHTLQLVHNLKTAQSDYDESDDYYIITPDVYIDGVFTTRIYGITSGREDVMRSHFGYGDIQIVYSKGITYTHKYGSRRTVINVGYCVMSDEETERRRPLPKCDNLVNVKVNGVLHNYYPPRQFTIIDNYPRKFLDVCEYHIAQCFLTNNDDWYDIIMEYWASIVEGATRYNIHSDIDLHSIWACYFNNTCYIHKNNLDFLTEMEMFYGFQLWQLDVETPLRHYLKLADIELTDQFLV